MKLNIKKFQEGGQLAPWVGYSPFFQPIGREEGTSVVANSSAKSGDTKIDNSQKQLKDIIGQMVGKGLTNEVNYFAEQVGNIFADTDLLGQPISVRQYTGLVSRLNEIQNNKQIFDQAKEHALSKGTLSEAAIDYSGNLFAQNSNGELVMITPDQYSESREEYRVLTNNDLLTLRNNSKAYIFDNSLSQTVAGSLNINDISKRIEEIVKSIGVEKQSSDYYFDKARATQLERGLQAIVSEKLNTAPDGTFKLTEEVSTQRKNANLALNYIWNNLDQQSRNTLIARAAINNTGDPRENAIESIKNILIFGTDHSYSQSLKDEAIEGKSGSGSGGSGGMTDINPLMSYVSDPKNQKYTINVGNKYSFDAKASIRPLIGSKGEVLNENYLSDIITDGGLGSLVDISGASVGTGITLNPNDLSKVLYEGDRIAMTWLPYVTDPKTGSKVVDLNALKRLEDADNEISAIGPTVTEDQKLNIYRAHNVDHLILRNGEPAQSQLSYMHQFMVIPSLIPEEVAKETQLNKVTKRLSNDLEDKARDMYSRVRSNLENKLLRANGYVPPEYWLLSDDDIYKSSIFLPVQDELMSILFTGKTAPQTAKSNLGYENVIRNTNQITQQTGGLNPEAFK
jgi:hypothetical protein